MRKKVVCAVLVLVLAAFFWYLKPQKVHLEMTMCAQDGETVHVVLSAKWYRHRRGNRTLEGDIWVDGELYHSARVDGWDWERHFWEDLIPGYISEHWKWPVDEVQLRFLGDGLYEIGIRHWDPDSYKVYYGPADSLEELEPIIQKLLGND